MGIGAGAGAGIGGFTDDGTWVCKIGVNGAGDAFGTGMSVFWNASGVTSVIVLVGSGFGGSIFSPP